MNETINDIVEDVIIVRDEIEEFVDGQSIGTFIYDKGIILVFKDHQIGIELDSWMAEIIAFFRSSDALSKLTMSGEMMVMPQIVDLIPNESQSALQNRN